MPEGFEELFGWGITPNDLFLLHEIKGFIRATKTKAGEDYAFWLDGLIKRLSNTINYIEGNASE